MNAKEFSQRLAEIVPLAEQVAECLSIDLDSANSILKNWNLPPKTYQNITTDSIFKDFTLNYECFNLQIGVIAFYEKVQKWNHYSFFSMFEEDMLCFNEDTSEVTIIDSDSFLGEQIFEVIHYVSPSFETFLDVLFVYSELEKLRFLLQVKMTYDIKMAFYEKTVINLPSKYHSFVKEIFVNRIPD